MGLHHHNMTSEALRVDIRHLQRHMSNPATNSWLPLHATKQEQWRERLGIGRALEITKDALRKVEEAEMIVRKQMEMEKLGLE